MALVSSSSGGMLFNSMGHSGLWFSGGWLDEDEVYNWGAYDGTRKDLGPAFLSGRMMFWVAHEVWPVQWKRNVRQERSVVVQTLDVPSSAVETILRRLEIETRPENREYLYHWAKNNCATRARDIIDEATGGQLKQALSVPVPQTARFEGSRHLARFPESAYAWNFMASAYVDQPLQEWDLGMVPERLMESLAKVQVSYEGSPQRPLVVQTCGLREGKYSWARKEPLPTWPLALGTGGLALLGALLAGRGTAGRVLAGLGFATWGLLAGLLGTATFILWAISQLDGVGPTENWFQASPLTLLLVWLGLRKARGKPTPRLAARLVLGLAGLGTLGLLLKPLPFLAQANLDMIAVFLPPLLAAAWVWHKEAR